MNWFIGIMMVLAISGLGGSIESGLKDLGDSIKIANGYVQKCDGPWYNRNCEWVKR